MAVEKMLNPINHDAERVSEMINFHGFVASFISF